VSTRAALLLALSTLAACAPDREDSEVPSVSTTEGHPLADAAFDFCHRPRRLERSERRWCDLLDAAAEARCPGLAASCRDEVEEAPRGCSDPKKSPGSDAAEPRASAPPAPASVAMDGLGAVLRWTVALLVVLGLVGVVGLIVRAVRGRGGRSVPPPAAPQAPTVVRLDADEPIELLHASDTLLDQARRALDEGRLDDAVLLARAAALRGLADREIVRLHPARTDREYVRAARRHPAEASALREIVAVVEQARWGRVPTAGEQARAVVDVAGRLIALTLAFIAFTALAPTSAAATDTFAADGLAGFTSIFKTRGATVRPRSRSLASLGPEVDVLILDADEVWLDDEALRAAVDWASDDGGTLVVLGAPSGLADAIGFELLRVDVDARLAVAGEEGPLPVWPQEPRTALVGGHRWTGARIYYQDLPPSLVTWDDVAAVFLVRDLGEGWLIVLTDPAVLRNAALARPENLAFAERLVARVLASFDAPPTVEIVAFPLADSPSSPAESMRNARLLPLVLQGLALLAIAAAWRGVPFGRPRDPPEQGRRDLAEHARALGGRYRALGATRHIASAQAALWIERIGVVGLQQAAERHGYPPDRARSLVARLRSLADTPSAPDAPSDLTTLEELWTIVHPP